jgi:hypothetical protein
MIADAKLETNFKTLLDFFGPRQPVSEHPVWLSLAGR